MSEERKTTEELKAKIGELVTELVTQCLTDQDQGEINYLARRIETNVDILETTARLEQLEQFSKKMI